MAFTCGKRRLAGWIAALPAPSINGTFNCPIALRGARPVFAPKKYGQPARAMDTEEIAPFNFDVAAELFPLRGKGGRTPIGYRRFETAAEAVRFAIEVLPGAL